MIPFHREIESINQDSDTRYMWFKMAENDQIKIEMNLYDIGLSKKRKQAFSSLLHGNQYTLI